MKTLKAYIKLSFEKVRVS